MANNKRSKSAENYSAMYKSTKRQEKNRKTKLERQLKIQPNNEQVKQALKDIKYRRKTPTAREWSATWITTAKIIKLFSGRFDRAIMSSNQDVARAALQKQGPIAASMEKVKDKKNQTYVDKNFFSIGARIRGVA